MPTWPWKIDGVLGMKDVRSKLRKQKQVFTEKLTTD